MRRHPALFAAAIVSFAPFLAAPASGQNVLRIHDGQQNGDGSDPYLGTSVAFVGDVDGDGVDDYAVGAPEVAPGGEAYVYSGRSGALLYTFHGEGSFHEFGTDVAPAGDVDGDGRADLLVVAPQAPSAHYFFDDGKVYLYSGATGALLLSVQGTNDENLRYARSIGDVDGDLVPDFAAVAYAGGDVHAYSGRTGAMLWTLPRHGTASFSGPVASLDDVDGDGVPDLAATGFEFLVAIYAGVYSGADGTEIRRHTLQSTSGLASIRDLDGDGLRELAVADPAAASGKGAVYVYSGSSGSLLLTLNGAVVKDDTFGLHLADAGDVNGDGVNELAVQTDVRSSARTKSRVQLFRLDTGIPIATFSSEFQGFGNGLAGGSDVDGDGRSELLVGSPWEFDHPTRSGRAWIYRGDDLFLFANEAWFASGDLLVLDSRPGETAEPCSIWLFDVNGSPFVLPVASGGYNSKGSFWISGIVPTGLAGIDLGFMAFGLDSGGHLHRSAVTNVEFR